MKKSNLFYKDYKQEKTTILRNTAEIEVLLMYLYTKTNCNYCNGYPNLVDMVKESNYIDCDDKECDSIVENYILYFTVDEYDFLKDFISMVPSYIKDLGDSIYNDYNRILDRSIV